MKLFTSFSFALLFIVFTACNSNAQNNVLTPATTAATSTALEIGDAAPMADYAMLDVSGAKVSIKESMLENGLLVIFSCNECPYVIGWEDRYPVLSEICKANNVGMLVVNSNEAKRADADSYDAMRKHAIEKGYNFAYTVDEKHQLADAFGATRTPELFLFDKSLQLAYKGCIDDNMKEPEKVEQFYIKNAIANMVAGNAIDPNVTKSIGCTIKRLN